MKKRSIPASPVEATESDMAWSRSRNAHLVTELLRHTKKKSAARATTPLLDDLDKATRGDTTLCELRAVGGYNVLSRLESGGA